jgi:predicted phage terminase large subunit-like protein
MDNWESKINDILVDVGLPPDANGRKILFSRSMELFGYYYFPHILTKPNNPFHTWLYKKSFDILSKTEWKKGVKLAVAAPRGYAKSSLLSFVLPMWCMCFERKKYIVLISETAGQTEDYLDDIKSELMGNSKLRKDFPQACGKSDTRWRQDDIILKNGVRVRGIGRGGRIRGRKYRGTRPDLILIDDIESRDSVESPDVRNKLWNAWFLKEVIKAGNLDGTSDFIALGTILHEDSILSKLLDHRTSPDWEKKKFKAVYEFATNQKLWDEWQHIYMMHEDEDMAAEEAWKFYKKNEKEMLHGTKILWPENETYYDLMVMRLTPEGESAFLSEKQNDPIDVTRVEITKEELRTFTLEPFRGRGYLETVVRLEEEEHLHPSELRTIDELVFYGAWDPSKGKKARSGDYSAVTTVGKDRDGIVYVFQFDLKRRDVERRMEDILQLHQKYGYRLFVVETTAFQYFVKDALVKRAKFHDSDLKNKIREDTGQTDKLLRIQGLVPYAHDGTLRFLHHTQWNMEYREGINQLVGFNAGAKYDDAPDSLAMAFEVVKHGVFRRRALIDGETVAIGQ